VTMLSDGHVRPVAAPGEAGAAARSPDVRSV